MVDTTVEHTQAISSFAIRTCNQCQWAAHGRRQLFNYIICTMCTAVQSCVHRKQCYIIISNILNCLLAGSYNPTMSCTSCFTLVTQPIHVVLGFQFLPATMTWCSLVLHFELYSVAWILPVIYNIYVMHYNYTSYIIA